MVQILDPTDERKPVARQLAPRPESLQGRVALLDIGKARGNVVIDRLHERLQAEAPGVQVLRFRKPTFTKPAPDALRQEIKGAADFVIEALAD